MIAVEAIVAVVAAMVEEAVEGAVVVAEAVTRMLLYQSCCL